MQWTTGQAVSIREPPNKLGKWIELTCGRGWTDARREAPASAQDQNSQTNICVHNREVDRTLPRVLLLPELQPGDEFFGTCSPRRCKLLHGDRGDEISDDGCFDV